MASISFIPPKNKCIGNIVLFVRYFFLSNNCAIKVHFETGYIENAGMYIGLIFKGGSAAAIT